MSDDASLPKWRDGLRSSERLSHPGTLDGARYAETLETPLGLRKVTVELTATPPTALAFRVIDGPIRPHGSMTLHEIAGATEITYRLVYEPRLKTPLDTTIFAALTASVDRSLDTLVARAREM